MGVYWGNSSEALDFLEYGKSKDAALDGYHLQQNGTVKAPALVFSYYVMVSYLEELYRKDEALKLIDSYQAVCSNPLKTSDNDYAWVRFKFSCLLPKVVGDIDWDTHCNFYSVSLGGGAHYTPMGER